MKKQLQHKHFNRTITFIIALVIVLNCGSFIRASQVESTFRQFDNISKIGDDVLEAMAAAGDDELIPVCLWRTDIDSAELNALILERSGFDPEIYENVMRFNEFVVPEIEEAVRTKLHLDDGSISTEIQPDQEEASLIKKATRERIEDYIHQKRLVVREENTKRNTTFLEKIFVRREDRKLFFCSKYTSTIFIEATKSEIEMLVSDETIESISLHEDLKCEATLNDVLSPVGVYCEGGTGNEYSGISPALTGMDIKIGVLEGVVVETNGDGGQFDATAPQLNGNTNLHFINNVRDLGGNVPYAPSKHATMVVSILAGQTYVHNGKTYRGVVPNATIYQTPVVNFDDIATGIEACLQYDVSIINMSIGNLGTTYYTDYDKQIDKFVRENNVTIVVSAGNETMGSLNMIRSPGRANNAITVGNAKTKASADVVLSAPYSLASDSCYFEPPYCPNKPDLVAPGFLSVPIYNEDTSQIEPYFESGTSFSAPIVAGIAAQIIENNPAFGVDPMLVKAALLFGADLSLVDTSIDTQTTPFVYNKCGAGMVNAMNSVEADIHIEYYGAITQSVIPMNTYDYYYYTGDRIRAVLTFNKYNNLEITSTNDLDDLDLLLVKRDNVQGDQLVGYSSSSTNNNEIIDVEISADGEYYFIIYVRHIADYNNPPVAAFEFKHYN